MSELKSVKTDLKHHIAIISPDQIDANFAEVCKRLSHAHVRVAGCESADRVFDDRLKEAERLIRVFSSADWKNRQDLLMIERDLDAKIDRRLAAIEKRLDGAQPSDGIVGMGLAAYANETGLSPNDIAQLQGNTEQQLRWVRRHDAAIRAEERKRAARIVRTATIIFAPETTAKICAAILDGTGAEDHWSAPTIPLTPLRPVQSRTITGYEPDHPVDADKKVEGGLGKTVIGQAVHDRIFAEKTYTQDDLDQAVLAACEGLYSQTEMDAAIEGAVAAALKKDRERCNAWIDRLLEAFPSFATFAGMTKEHILNGDEVPG